MAATAMMAPEPSTQAIGPGDQRLEHLFHLARLVGLQDRRPCKRHPEIAAVDEDQLVVTEPPTGKDIAYVAEVKLYLPVFCVL